MASNSRKFQWNPEMTENLIKCLQNYKIMMCYKIKDFDEDRPAQYRFIREARSYGSDTEEVGDFFGPEKPYKMLLNGGEELPSEVLVAEKIKEEETNKSIKQGYKRILEKIKEIRQKSSVITTGTQ